MRPPVAFFWKNRVKWTVYELLLSKKLGDQAVKTVKREKEDITRRRAIASSFGKALKTVCEPEKAKQFRGTLASVLGELIKTKAPVSDEMLLSVWEDKECREGLWEVLSKACSETLQIPVKKTAFVWFEKYILQSGVKF